MFELFRFLHRLAQHEQSLAIEAMLDQQDRALRAEHDANEALSKQVAIHAVNQAKAH